MKRIAASILCAAVLIALLVPLAAAQSDASSDRAQDKARPGQEDRVREAQDKAREARERAQQWQEKVRHIRELAQQTRLQREELREHQAEIINLRMRLREVLADKPQPDQSAVELIRAHTEAVRRLTQELRDTAGKIRKQSQGLQLGRLRQNPEAVEGHLNEVIVVQRSRIDVLRKISAELQAILELVAGATAA